MNKKLFIIIFVFGVLTNNTVAIEPDVFVQSTVNRASKLLSENITKEEKIKQLKLIAKDTVDIKELVIILLGQQEKI